MQMRIKTLLKDKILYIAICITLGIAYLSLRRLDFLPGQLSQLDKVYHAIAYFVLTLTWLFSFSKSLENNKIKYLVAVSCVIYGIIIEVLQVTLTNYRSASLLDTIANTTGVILAMMFFKIIYKKIIAI